MAIYEVPSIQFFHNPRYTKLRANRSPREADLVQRLETLDRRTGQWVQEAGQRSKSTQEAVAPVVVTLGLPGQTEVDLAETFHGIEGCRRATAWNIYDALLMRHGCAPAPNVGPKAFLVAGERVLKSLCLLWGPGSQRRDITEFDSADALQSDAYNKALDALKNQGVLDEAELRTWQLYRACVAFVSLPIMMPALIPEAVTVGKTQQQDHKRAETQARRITGKRP